MALQMAASDTAETLRALINEYGLTVNYCAELCGMSRTNFSRILNGHQQPSFTFARYVERIAAEMRQNPPEPTPIRKCGHRQEVCAQRAPRR